MLTRIFKIAIAASALAGCLGAPALAQGSIGGGIYTESGNGQSATGGAIILSSSAPVPVLPVSVGLTGFAPLARGGGYALTVDGAFHLGTDAIGVGYGIGQFGAAHSGGTGTIFFDHKLTPMAAIELRAYRTMNGQGATAGFAGVKFSL